MKPILNNYAHTFSSNGPTFLSADSLIQHDNESGIFFPIKGGNLDGGLRGDKRRN